MILCADDLDAILHEQLVVPTTLPNYHLLAFLFERLIVLLVQFIKDWLHQHNIAGAFDALLHSSQTDQKIFVLQVAKTVDADDAVVLIKRPLEVFYLHFQLLYWMLVVLPHFH